MKREVFMVQKKKCVCVSTMRMDETKFYHGKKQEKNKFCTMMKEKIV